MTLAQQNNYNDGLFGSLHRTPLLSPPARAFVSLFSTTKMPIKDDLLITPRKRELVDKILEKLQELEEVEREYSELEDAYERQSTRTMASCWRPRIVFERDAPPASAPVGTATVSPLVPRHIRDLKSGQGKKGWAATKALFVQRDELRRPLFAALIRNKKMRHRVVGEMVENPSPQITSLLKLDFAQKRDIPIIDALLKAPPNRLAKLILEALEHCDKVAPRTAKDIRAAWTLIKHIEDAIVAANMGLCFSQARKFGWSQVPEEELVQEGAIGLQTAVERFDVARGLHLSTYAVNWIRHHIMRYIQSYDMVRIPVHLYSTNLKMYKMRDEGKTDEEIASLLGKKVSTIRALHNWNRPPLSTDKVIRNSEIPMLDLLVEADPESQLDPEAVAQEREMFARLDLAMEQIPSRQRYVIRQRMEGKTLDEIGQVLDLSRERVRQLETKAKLTLQRLVQQGRLT